MFACAASLLKRVVAGAAARDRLAAPLLCISPARKTGPSSASPVCHHSFCVTGWRACSGQVIVPSLRTTCALTGTRQQVPGKPANSTLRFAPDLGMQFVAIYDGSDRDVVRAEAVLCDHISALMRAAQLPAAQQQQHKQADKFVQQHTLRQASVGCHQSVPCITRFPAVRVLAWARSARAHVVL